MKYQAKSIALAMALLLPILLLIPMNQHLALKVLELVILLAFCLIGYFYFKWISPSKEALSYSQTYSANAANKVN